MNTNNNENGNSQNTNGEEDVVLETGFDENESDPEVLKEQLKRKDENASQLYTRLKKAEGFIKVDGKWIKPAPKTEEKKQESNSSSSKDSLKSTDVYTLIKNNVAEEDIDDVIEFANFKGISVAEALKTSTVKNILAEKAEQRKVAEGTNTGGSRRGSAKLSDEALLSEAEKGNFPQSEEDLKRLITLQRKNR